MTVRHLNDEDRAEIWALHGQGYLATEIHKKTGRSFTTVTALIKRHGGIRPALRSEPTGRRLDDGDRDEIALGLAASDTYVTIAERIGRHHSTVSSEVGRNGGRHKYRSTAGAIESHNTWIRNRVSLQSYTTRNRPASTRSHSASGKPRRAGPGRAPVLSHARQVWVSSSLGRAAHGGGSGECDDNSLDPVSAATNCSR